MLLKLSIVQIKVDFYRLLEFAIIFHVMDIKRYFSSIEFYGRIRTILNLSDIYKFLVKNFKLTC
jgi:hypothetical protein